MPSATPRATLPAEMFRSKDRNPSDRLRTAVDALPRATKVAMLRGMQTNTIIAGAYTDPGSGGICPMLAAHRNGGRTALASFARSWDRFTGAKRPRCATTRELERLRTYLEMSLWRDAQEGMSVSELAAEVRTRRAKASAQPSELTLTPSRPRSERVETGETDRTDELRDLPGWGWLTPVREWDGYLEQIAAAREQLHEQRAREGETVTEPALGR